MKDEPVQPSSRIPFVFRGPAGFTTHPTSVLRNFEASTPVPAEEGSVLSPSNTQNFPDTFKGPSIFFLRALTDPASTRLQSSVCLLICRGYSTHTELLLRLQSTVGQCRNDGCNEFAHDPYDKVTILLKKQRTDLTGQGIT